MAQPADVGPSPQEIAEALRRHQERQAQGFQGAMSAPSSQAAAPQFQYQPQQVTEQYGVSIASVTPGTGEPGPAQIPVDSPSAPTLPRYKTYPDDPRMTHSPTNGPIPRQESKTVGQHIQILEQVLAMYGYALVAMAGPQQGQFTLVVIPIT